MKYIKNRNKGKINSEVENDISAETREDRKLQKNFRRRITKIILRTLLALVIILFCFTDISIKREKHVISTSPVETAPLEQPILNKQGLRNLCVTYFMMGSANRATEETIRWWQNEEDDKYYIFLPAATNMDSLRVLFEGVDAIYLDGEKIQNAKKIQTTLGEHTITTDLDDTTYQVVFMKSSNLPAVFVHTESGNMDYVNETEGNEESGTILVTNESGDITYLGPLEYIAGRGNATWDADKRGYKIKFSKKQNLFNMGKEKSWVLLANDGDSSMVRNSAAYAIAATSKVAFTPESQYIDLYLNATYWGTYQLCEKVEVSKERVDIPDMDAMNEEANPGLNLSECKEFRTENEQGTVTVPGTQRGYILPEDPIDITGGYLLELEMGGRYVHETAGFVSNRNQAVVIKTPKYASVAETTYISNLYQDLEDALYEYDGMNPNTGRAYYEYIDVNSFAKKYLVEEITKNIDAMITSQYLYKYPDTVSDKLYAGPVWDYDNAIGNAHIASYEEEMTEDGETDYGADTASPQGLYAMRNQGEAPIWYALYYRPEFQEAFKRNYNETFRSNTLLVAEEQITQVANLIEDSSLMNSMRWKDGTIEEKEDIRAFYRSEVEEVKNFLIERIDYLDKEWD